MASSKKDCGCTEIAAQNERANMKFDSKDTVGVMYVGPGEGRLVAQYRYRDYNFPTNEVVQTPRELAYKLIGQGVFVLVEEEEEEEKEVVEEEVVVYGSDTKSSKKF